MEYDGTQFRVMQPRSDALLFEGTLSDRITDVTVNDNGRVSFSITPIGGTLHMLAFNFESPYEAPPFAKWLQSTAQVVARALPREHVTTLLDIPGYRIVRTLGVVTGINVRSAGPWGQFTAGIKSIIGGSLGSFITLSKDARRVAFEAMVRDAVALGANAVLGLHYDSNDVVEGATEVMCYGTAAVIEALRPQE